MNSSSKYVLYACYLFGCCKWYKNVLNCDYNYQIWLLLFISEKEKKIIARLTITNNSEIFENNVGLGIIRINGN